MNLGELNLHENLLRHLWNKKYLSTNNFISTTGEKINVENFGELHFGFGPDFQNAKIKINTVNYCGNIEFHKNAKDWVLHAHNKNKIYNTTILHVVLTGDDKIVTRNFSKRIIPTVILKNYLINNISELTEQLMRDEGNKIFDKIPCFTKNDFLEPEIIEGILPKLAIERFYDKSILMEEELYFWIDKIIKSEKLNLSEKDLLHQSSVWENLLFSNLCDALGFSQYRNQMKKLAELTPLTNLKNNDNKSTITELQSLLLFISGFYPETQKDQQTKIYYHELKQANNLINKFGKIKKISQTSWLTHPTRPSNHPLIRIVAASYLLKKILDENLFFNIINNVEKNKNPEELLLNFDLLLKLPYDKYWSNYWNFNTPSLKSHSLLGKPRRLDIIVNVFIPLILLYSKIFSKNILGTRIIKYIKIIPALQQNFKTKKMEKQLIKEKIKITKAFEQQALIQLYDQYCTKEKCFSCEIGEKVFTITT
ncbi:MAG: DUF2851 family protein [Bacteroidetes bacterium]|nr:DUF2851 family protein [Bacteroidota bacterium]